MKDKVNRKKYLDWLLLNKDSELIKVISGVRRSGKSTLFELYKQILIQQFNVIEKQLIHLNFEDLIHYELRDFLKLNRFILDFIADNPLPTGQKFYIFFDEIQHVEKFEEVVNSLNLNSQIDLYITGSNAYFMSGELATLLTGRYTELKILPLSFKEFSSVRPELPLMEAYHAYKQTAFPYLINEEHPDLRKKVEKS